MQIQITPKLPQHQTQDEALLDLAEKVRVLPAGEDRAIARVRYARRLNDAGDFDRAHQQLKLADMEAPDHPFVYRGLGLVQFRNGRIRDGLRLYDKGRWQLPSFDDLKRPYAFPHWNGQNLKNKKILVWAEQGVGDQIMHARILPELVAAGADVSVECEPRLISLLKRALPMVRFEAQSVPLVADYVNGDFDYQSSMFSAWRWARRPGAHVSCIKPNRIMARRFRNAWGYDDHGDQPKLNVGLAWFSKAPLTGERRSIDLAALEILAKIGGDRVRFHNLQYGVTDLEAESRKLGAPLWCDEKVDQLKNLDTAAAQVSALDLVVSIDNATVHLAGALDIPTWVLLPKGSEFRWQKHETQSMLYPSVRLFRNDDSSNWGLPILRLTQAFENMLSKR